MLMSEEKSGVETMLRKDEVADVNSIAGQC